MFQMFNEDCKTGTYATYERAIKQAQKVERDNARYLIATNDAGRFFPVFIGSETVDLVHAGYHVAG